MKTTSFLNGAAALLIALFMYTASSKLLDFTQFKVELSYQTIPHPVAVFLLYTLPGIEISIALLLVFQRTRLIGFIFSLLLMTVFTIYIALILVDFFGRTPCSCGGVIKSLGWKSHFVFNLFFLLLAAAGVFAAQKERRKIDRDI